MSVLKMYLDSKFTIPAEKGLLYFKSEEGLEEGESKTESVWVLFTPFKPEHRYRISGVSVQGDAGLADPNIKPRTLKAGESLEIQILWVGKKQTPETLSDLKATIMVEGRLLSS